MSAAGNYGTASVGTPAEFGTRAVAWLIDWAIMFGGFLVVFILALILGAIADALGLIVGVLGYLAVLGFGIWNYIIKQGQTGQTIGKEKQGIRLVADATGQPVGPGMAFARGVVGSLMSLLCGVGQIVDYLFPLFDEDKKRLTDKILKFSVIPN